MAVLRPKIQASTLVEVVIGMVIIMIVFGLAMMIFANIQTSENTGLKIFAGMHIDRVFEETMEEKSLFDEDYKIESIRIEKTISPYQNSNNIVILEFTAYDNKGKSLLSKKELVKSISKYEL